MIELTVKCVLDVIWCTFWYRALQMMFYLSFRVSGSPWIDWEAHIHHLPRYMTVMTVIAVISPKFELLNSWIFVKPVMDHPNGHREYTPTRRSSWVDWAAHAYDSSWYMTVMNRYYRYFSKFKISKFWIFEFLNFMNNRVNGYFNVHILDFTLRLFEPREGLSISPMWVKISILKVEHVSRPFLLSVQSLRGVCLDSKQWKS